MDLNRFNSFRSIITSETFFENQLNDYDKEGNYV